MGDTCNCPKDEGRVILALDDCPEHGTIDRREHEAELARVREELDRVRTACQQSNHATLAKLDRERAAREKAEAERDEALEDRAETKAALGKLERLHTGESRQRKQAEARLERLRGEEAVERVALVRVGKDYPQATAQQVRDDIWPQLPEHIRAMFMADARQLLEAALLERGEG